MYDDDYVSDLENQLEEIILEKEKSPVDLLIVLYLNIENMSIRAKTSYIKSSIEALKDGIGDTDRIKVVALESSETKIEYVPIKALLTSVSTEADLDIQEKLDCILEELKKKNKNNGLG